MAAYLDSAGNVNTAVANDVANMIYMLRAAQAVPQAQPNAVAAGAVVVADGVTGVAVTSIA